MPTLRPSRCVPYHRTALDEWPPAGSDNLLLAHLCIAQPKAHIQSLSNTASISLESALPPTLQASTLLAPEEVFNPPSASDLVASSELTPSEKRARHGKDKKRRRKHRDQLQAMEGMAGQTGRKRVGTRQAKDEALKTLVKEGKGVRLNLLLLLLFPGGLISTASVSRPRRSPSLARTPRNSTARAGDRMPIQAGPIGPPTGPRSSFRCADGGDLHERLFTSFASRGQGPCCRTTSTPLLRKVLRMRLCLSAPVSAWTQLLDGQSCYPRESNATLERRLDPIYFPGGSRCFSERLARAVRVPIHHVRTDPYEGQGRSKKQTPAHGGPLPQTGNRLPLPAQRSTRPPARRRRRCPSELA